MKKKIAQPFRCGDAERAIRCRPRAQWKCMLQVPDTQQTSPKHRLYRRDTATPPVLNPLRCRFLLYRCEYAFVSINEAMNGRQFLHHILKRLGILGATCTTVDNMVQRPLSQRWTYNFYALILRRSQVYNSVTGHTSVEKYTWRTNQNPDVIVVKSQQHSESDL
jgi:hypothetical protein